MGDTAQHNGTSNKPDTTGDDAEYTLTVEEVAARLGVQRRQAYRYSEGSHPRIRTRMVERHKLFHRGDTDALAAERNATPHARPSRTELVPIGEMLGYLQETQDKLNRAMLEIGRLQGQLEAANERIRQLEAPQPDTTPATTPQLEPQAAASPSTGQPTSERIPFWKRWLLRRTS